MITDSFSVQFDSELGSKLNSYFQTTALCSKAVRDFLVESSNFGFADLSDPDSIEIIPADAEAGGLQAIFLPSDADSAAIDRCLWASHRMTDGTNLTAWFPRIYSESHYLPYGEVLDLLLAKAEAKISGDPARMRALQRWENPDGRRAKPKERTYGEVRQFVTDEDRARLTRKGDKTPLPQLSVARLVRYDFIPVADEEAVILPKDFESTEKFAVGIELWKKFSQLPVVRNGTLSLLLGLQRPEASADSKEPFAPSLSWQIDKEARVYKFTTNLTSDNPDLRPAN